MNGEQLFDLVNKYNHALNDTPSLNSMSPGTRERWVSNMKTQRKKCIDRMMELND